MIVEQSNDGRLNISSIGNMNLFVSINVLFQHKTEFVWMIGFKPVKDEVCVVKQDFSYDIQSCLDYLNEMSERFEDGYSYADMQRCIVSIIKWKNETNEFLNLQHNFPQ